MVHILVHERGLANTEKQNKIGVTQKRTTLLHFKAKVSNSPAVTEDDHLEKSLLARSHDEPPSVYAESAQQKSDVSRRGS